MSAVSEIINAVERKDSLGRRNSGWTNAGPGRRKGTSLYNKQLNIRVDEEMFDRIRKNKISSEKLRTYLEWGLENDKV